MCVCVCGCLLVCDTVSPRPPAVSPKGEAKSCRWVHLCASVSSLCPSASVCIRCTSQLNCGTGRQRFRQRGRGVKQIKHKPTNHRRRLISAVLKGKPGMMIPPYEFPDAVPCATMNTTLSGHELGERRGWSARRSGLAVILSESAGSKWRSISPMWVSVMCTAKHTHCHKLPNTYAQHKDLSQHP